MQQNRLTLVALTAAMFITAPAKTQTVIQGKTASAIIAEAELIRTSKFSSLPSYIRFQAGKELQHTEWQNWFTQKMAMDFQNSFSLVKAEKDKLGHVHYRYQQTLNGVPVKNGIWIVHTKSGKVYSMNGLVYKSISLGNASLSEADALQKALAHVGAKKYKWEIAVEEKFIKEKTGDPTATFYPKAQLLYTSKGNRYEEKNTRLAYVFNIYASEPLYRSEVFVDAATGEILDENELIHEADTPGTAVTAYSGSQTIIADSFGGSFRLQETGRGDGIRTFNMLTGTNYGSAVDFTDADNFWNNVNPQMDEVATDAHWGAEMTYDYFMNEHGRNSIDGAGFALESYVHFDAAYSNAFWDGSVMTYGDGDGSTFNPFTALDIAGHEIAHGLTTFTANLDYQDESGALNESFSDIFGAAIEFHYATAVSDWLMGEDIGTVIRNMANPSSMGDPDTYFGTNWAPLGGADNGGVHTNSAIQNFWFYLLCDGGSGTNDNGDAYNISPLGLNNAEDIAFRNLTVYLTPTSQFDDARFYSIQSAVDLFGGCTFEVEQVTNAWYAVGVGPAYVAEVTAGFSPNTTGGCASPMTVDFANTSSNGVSYTWDFGDGGTSTLSNPSHTYTVNGVYTVTLIADGGLCGIDTMVVTDQVYVGQLPDPTVTEGGRCDAGTVELFASGSGSINWYTAPTGGSAIATGTSYTTPVIGATTTYYVEAATGGTSYVGPVTTAIGTTGTTASNRWLIFDAMQPFTLVSVWVNANTAGNRTIELRNSSGAVLQSATVFIPAGMGRITLNFNVPVGTNMQLGTSAASVPTDLLRNSSGVTYPYTIPGLVSITGSNGGAAYYYFFYDWECSTGSCTSARVPVVAGISTSGPTTVDDFRCGPGIVNLSAAGTTGTLNWYDAATGGTLVNTGSTYSPAISATTTYYVEEQMPPVSDFVGAVDNTFGGGGYFSGDQWLIFDVLGNCTLQSVKVYAGSSGNRTIELRNSSGAVINSITVNIPAGESRVTLGFPLTPGTNYELGWPTGSAPDLYRNNAGTPAYPYTLAGLVSITTSSPGTGYYYAYYDWEVTTPGCTTARTAVTGDINAADATITSPGAFCTTDAALTLTAADTGGVWSGPGITDTLNGIFDPSVAGPGTHTITYTITGACSDVGTQNILVTDGFDATITPLNSPLCNTDGTTTMTGANSGGVWSADCGACINSSTGEFDPAVAGVGSWTVIYSLSGSCGDTDTTLVSVQDCLGITGETTAFGVQVYPNPASSMLLLNIKNAPAGEVFAALTNGLGQTVWTNQTKLSSVLIPVNVENFSRGVYMVTIVSGNQRLTTRIVIE